MKNWFKTNTDSSPKDKKWWKPNISWLKLDKWVKRLDIYIIKKFLGTYFFAIALIISIAVVFDVNENIDRFINNKAPLKAIVFDYYMNFIPYFSNLFSPLFVFIAVIFFTSKLAENSEIIAMFSTGMSFKRMMRPYMISAAIISVVTFGLGAYVIPKGNVTRLDFEDRYKKKKKQEYVRNVQLEVDSGVIAYIERYENYNKTGYRFSLDKFDDKKLVAHLTARSVTYDTASVHKWTIKNYMIREMEGMREKITRGDRLDTIIKMEPQDFLIMKGQQQTMTSPELKEYIDKQKRRGFANIKEFEIEYAGDRNLPYTVEKEEDGIFVVEGPRIEKMLGYTNLESEKGFQFFQNFLKENGILDELESAGIQEGDTVRMYGLSFDYYK